MMTWVMVAAAGATFLLPHVTTYPMALVAALGVSIASGSFILGIAYVSPRYPKKLLRTALCRFSLA